MIASRALGWGDFTAWIQCPLAGQSDVVDEECLRTRMVGERRQGLRSKVVERRKTWGVV